MAVGPRGERRASRPAARTVDVTGKTIIPGLIDAHAHGPQGEDDLVPQQNWSTHGEPRARARPRSTIRRATRARSSPPPRCSAPALILAPRIFSTGEIVYGAKAPGAFAEIDNLDDALAHVRRLKAQGACSVKNYNQPRREQRQMVVAAAQAENMLVVPEGGSLFNMDMTLIADGNRRRAQRAGQHFYDDVLQSGRRPRPATRRRWS